MNPSLKRYLIILNLLVVVTLVSFIGCGKKIQKKYMLFEQPDTGTATYTATVEITLAGAYDTPGTTWDVQVSNNLAYVADGMSGMHILNVAAPTNPTLLSTFEHSNSAAYIYRGLHVLGNTAYIADSFNGLHVVDISNSSSPALLGTSVYKNAWDVYVLGNVAYLARSGAGITLIDISNSSAPAYISQFDTGYAYDVHARAVGNNSYVFSANAQNWGFQVTDVTNTSNLTRVYGYESLGSGRGIYVYASIPGTFAYNMDTYFGLQIFNITNPANPFRASSLSLPGSDRSVCVLRDSASGITYAYTASWNKGVHMVDVSNAYNPVQVGTYDFSETDTKGYAQELCVVGNYIFVAAADAGVQILQWQPITP